MDLYCLIEVFLVEKREKIMELRKNIRKNYLFILISRFDLTHGIWMLYLASKGLSLFQIGLMETVYHISSFSMEIPTGAIADIFGRKTSRILGRITSVFAITVMIFGQNVYAFAMGFFLTALSNNLESGAGDALIYDSLKELGEENTYMKIGGRNELFYQITKTFSLLVGSYIATLSYAGVYKAALVVSIVSVIQALSFVEPSIGKVKKESHLWLTFKNQLISSFTALSGNRELVEMIVALEVFSTFYTTEFFYMQNLLKSIGHSEFEIGIILALGALMAAVLATQTYKLEAKFKLKGLLTAVAIVAIISFWGMTIKGFEKFAFIMLSGTEGILFVVMGDYINKRIPSDKRATILSFQSMIFSVFMIALFPLVGFIGDLFGLYKSFTLVAIISSIALVLMIKLVRKK